MSTIYTIGYERTDIDRLIRALLAEDIDLLADVRAVPISRKRGFSKSALKATLEAAGVQYVHFGDLGDPKSGRLAARMGRLEEFRAIYTAHLREANARAALGRLAEVATRNVTCLLCFERDPTVCHRTIIAGRLAHRGFTKLDLCPDLIPPHDRLAAKLPGLHSRQGIATTEQEAR